MEIDPGRKFEKIDSSSLASANCGDASEKVLNFIETLIEEQRKDDNNELRKLEEDVDDLRRIIQVSLQPLFENSKKALKERSLELALIKEELATTKNKLERSEESIRKLECDLATTRNNWTKSEERIKALDGKLVLNESKQRESEKSIEKLKKEVNGLEERSKSQNEFCITLGAVMGKLLWQSASRPGIAGSFLKTRLLEEFLHLASQTIKSLSQTHSLAPFPENSKETQFLCSFFGTIANVAASAESWQILTSDTKCSESLRQIIAVLPQVNSHIGDTIRENALLMLFNVGLLRNGVKILQDQGIPLINMIGSAVRSQCKTVKACSLALLQVISENIEDYSYYKQLLNTIPKQDIENMQNDDQIQVKYLSEQILRNYKMLESKFLLYPSTNLSSNFYRAG